MQVSYLAEWALLICLYKIVQCSFAIWLQNCVGKVGNIKYMPKKIWNSIDQEAATKKKGAEQANWRQYKNN